MTEVRVKFPKKRDLGTHFVQNHPVFKGIVNIKMTFCLKGKLFFNNLIWLYLWKLADFQVLRNIAPAASSLIITPV